MPTHLPLVSIVTVTYNAEKYLESTINNILSQTYPHIEYIIIDGNSTDATVSIIEKYKDKLKYWESKKDKGMYDAINKGFAKAEGQILAYLNADDLYFEQTTVEKIVNIFTKTQADLVIGNTTYIDEVGEVLYKYRLPSITKNYVNRLQRLPFSQAACFWARTAYDEVQGFDTNLRLAADTKFFYALINKDKKIAQTSDTVALFRIHEDGYTTKAQAEMIYEGINMLKELKIYDTSFTGNLTRNIYEVMYKLYNVNVYINRFLGRR